MKIKLIQSGGLLPVKKVASTDVSWSEKDLEDVMSKIRIEETEHSLVRDGISYQLEVNGNEIAVDLNKVPGEHLSVFKDLKSKLTILKF
jgi:uncharacterized protein YacL (UPF0231 family)